MLSLNDPTPLPESLEMPNRSQNALDENDDTQLVPGAKIAPGAIVITNQIDQVSVPEQAQITPLGKQGATGGDIDWKTHPPTSTTAR